MVMGLLRKFSYVFLKLVRESEKYRFSKRLDSSCSQCTNIAPGAQFRKSFMRQYNADFSSGTLCLRVVEMPTIFPHLGRPRNASSYCLGKEKLYISKPIQLRKKSKRKGNLNLVIN